MTRKEKEAMAREAFEYGRCLLPMEDIIITDPEDDYAPLIEHLGGSVITTETRRESYGAAKQDAATRRRVILEILSGSAGMTAREIAAELHRRGVTPSDERNYAAPRLTELKTAGQIFVVGKKICDRTGRSVAVWSVKKGAT